MKLFLHIGTEKTGTTSIQNFFHRNRERLAERGVLYPEAPGKRNQTGLTMAAGDISKRDPLRRTAGLKSDEKILAFREEMFAELAREARAKPYRIAVMSGEHCSSRLTKDAEVTWLRDQLTPIFSEVAIVVYLRRQDDYLLSTYSTSIKSGNTQKLDIPKEQTIEKRYNHWNLLSRWARVFGRENIICRKFERASLTNGDVVEDFLGLVGIPPESLEKPEDVNESLDAEALEFLRLFNRTVPRFIKGAQNPLRGNIAAVLSRSSDGPLLTLSDEELAGFMTLFDDSNRRVAEEYFGGVRTDSDDPLFGRRSDKRARVRSVTLTTERAVELAAALWQEKQAQVARLGGNKGPALRRRIKESE